MTRGASMRLGSVIALALASVGCQESPTTSQPVAKEPAADLMPKLALNKGDQIVAMGDSITHAGGYLRTMQAVFDQQYPEFEIPTIINVGIGGQKAEDMVARFEQDVLTRKPNIITINVGINDVWHRLEKPHDEKVLLQYKKNVERMVRLGLDSGATVLLLTPTIIEEDLQSEGNARLAKYVEGCREIAGETGCVLADLHTLFLNAIQNYAKQNPPATQPAHFFTTDGVHMQPVGDNIMSVGVLRALGVPDKKIAETDTSGVFLPPAK